MRFPSTSSSISSTSWFAASIRARSTGSCGFWSTDIATAVPSAHTTMHRESPAFATCSRSPAAVRTTCATHAVLPSSTNLSWNFLSSAMNAATNAPATASSLAVAAPPAFAISAPTYSAMCFAQNRDALSPPCPSNTA